MAELEPEEGRKQGSLEAGAAFHRYYEPTVTAVTDMVVPATRIQWGPTFAGLLVTLGIGFLFLSLGLAIGLKAGGLLFWSTAFACVGLFFGSMLAARTAKAGTASAILHGIIIWTLLMMLDVFTFGAPFRGLVLAQIGTAQGVGAGAATAGMAIKGLGLWFFVGYLVMLAVSVLGGVAGASYGATHEETET